MGKKDLDAETDFDPAPPPRGPEKPLAGAKMDAPATQAPAENADAIVDRWFSDCIKGGPIGRHTQSYNHLQEALPELKRRLAKRED